MRVIQLTDCHVFTDPTAELKGIRTWETLERVVTHVAERYSDADRFIVTGDLTHDEQLLTYEALARLWAPFQSRLRVLPGNHDDRTKMAEVFASQVETIGERLVFSDVVSGWRLIGLDSQRTGQLSGELGAAQREWLAEQLRADSAQPVCLFLHHPPFSLDSLWLDQIQLQDGAEFWEIMARHSQVRLVCCGHVHQESTHRIGSSLLVTTPSTGVQFRPETAALQVDSEADPGYRVLELAHDGRIRTRVERVPISVRS